MVKHYQLRTEDKHIDISGNSIWDTIQIVEEVTGREFIGCEINKTYYETALKRIENND